MCLGYLLIDENIQNDRVTHETDQRDEHGQEGKVLELVETEAIERLIHELEHSLSRYRISSLIGWIKGTSLDKHVMEIMIASRGGYHAHHN